jgi:capping protein beta
MADGFTPSARLRAMEEPANQLFDIYRKLYFETGYSSVYFFDTEDKSQTAFGACFLIHKEVPATKTLKAGGWDSIHVFDVSESKKKGSFNYKLTTTVMVSMNLKEPEKTGDVDLSGHMTKQVEKERKMDGKVDTHISNMGVILEEMELSVRNAIEGIYIQKTREVINGMRSAQGDKEKMWGNIQDALKNSVLAHKEKRGN